MKFPFVRRSTHEQKIENLTHKLGSIAVDFVKEKRLNAQANEEVSRLDRVVSSLSKQNDDLRKQAKNAEDRYIEVVSGRLNIEGIRFSSHPVRIYYENVFNPASLSLSYILTLDRIQMSIDIGDRELFRYGGYIPYLKQSFSRAVSRKVSEEIEKQVLSLLNKEMK